MGHSVRATGHTEGSPIRLVSGPYGAHGVTRPTFARTDHLAAVVPLILPGTCLQFHLRWAVILPNNAPRLALRSDRWAGECRFLCARWAEAMHLNSR